MSIYYFSKLTLNLTAGKLENVSFRSGVEWSNGSWIDQNENLVDLKNLWCQGNPRVREFVAINTKANFQVFTRDTGLSPIVCEKNI